MHRWHVLALTRVWFSGRAAQSAPATLFETLGGAGASILWQPPAALTDLDSTQ
jgi:hypothetical protein